MWLLATTVAENAEKAVSIAERSQGILLKDLATGMIIVLLAMAFLEGLAIVWLVRMVLSFSRESVAHIERNTASNQSLTHAIQQSLQKRGGRIAGALGSEPPSQVGVPPR